jgi:hypothetical protein
MESGLADDGIDRWGRKRWPHAREQCNRSRSSRRPRPRCGPTAPPPLARPSTGRHCRQMTTRSVLTVTNGTAGRARGTDGLEMRRSGHEPPEADTAPPLVRKAARGTRQPGDRRLGCTAHTVRRCVSALEDPCRFSTGRLPPEVHTQRCALGLLDYPPARTDGFGSVERRGRCRAAR